MLEPITHHKTKRQITFSLHHASWGRDLAFLNTEVMDLIKCRKTIEKVILTEWQAFDEERVCRGEDSGLTLDITPWFMGERGFIHNPTLEAVSIAHAINQCQTKRTPWVKHIRMNLSLIVFYK